MSTKNDGHGALVWVESILIALPVRLALGGLIGLAGVSKLQGVQSFAEAIKGFRIVDAEKHGHLIISAAYTIPYVELIAALLVVLGLWTRAAAAALGLLLLGFIGALVRVILDESVSADCSCFGDIELFCEAGVGWCQVGRNAILLLGVGYLCWRKGGLVSIDAWCSGRSAQAGDPEWSVERSEP